MGTVGITVNRTKLLYATILKSIALWKQIRFRIEILSDMLPAVESQWDSFKKTVSPGISRKVAITASLSKADTVPDETRVPPQVDISGETVRLMNRLAAAFGLTRNTADYEWNDADTGYRRALETWASAINLYLEIEQMGADLTMHRAYGSDMYDELDETRTPGQLATYNECNIPLADGIFVDALSRPGLRAGLGTLYLDWLTKSIDELVMTDPPDIETAFADVAAEKADCPGFTGTKTKYAFSVPDGWQLGGAILAASPDLDTPDTFHQAVAGSNPEEDVAASGIWYPARALYLQGGYTGPNVPDTVEFRLLLIR